MKKRLFLSFIVVLVFSLCLSGTVSAEIRYGDVNIEEHRYPEIVREWFDGRGLIPEVPYDIPTFGPGYGSDEYGEVGWHTTQEDMLAFLKSLPTDRMKMEIVSEFVTRDEVGNKGKSFKWPLLVFSNPSVFHPEDLHALNKPILWFQGQIHGNEFASGEAMLVLAKQLATGELDHLLEEISVVIVPRYNVDGAYKNQRGTDTISPFQTGVDMNRDNTAFETHMARLIHTLINRYKPHVTLDGHEMGYSYAPERSEDEEVLTGSKSFHLFDLAVLNAAPLNVPHGVQDMSKNIFEANLYSDFEEQGMHAHWYWYNQNSEWVEADIYDYATGNIVPGERLERLEIREGNPDEGITDPSLALKPAVSLLFESRATRYKVSELGRVLAHVEGLKSLMNTAAENSDELMKTIEEGRQEFIDLGSSVSEDDEIVLWTEHDIIEHEFDVLSFTDDYSDLEITTENVIAHRTNENMTPVRTKVRPRAYIIEGTSEEIGPVMERLSYTGAQIERLNNSERIDVEAQTIKDIRNPREYTFHPRGSAMSGLSTAVNLTTTEEITKVFPADTFVVHMDQTAGTHTALALEPLGNRSYANYWLSRSEEEGEMQGGPHGGRIGFLPAIEGEEFQVYRYMGEERLDTYSITLDHPLVDETMIEEIYPLSRAQNEEYAQLVDADTVDYLNKFRVIKNTDSFNIFLPKSYAGISLAEKDWHLFDWETEQFVNISETPYLLEDDNRILVTSQYISDDFKVILAAGN